METFVSETFVTHVLNRFFQMFSEDERSKLVDDAHKYAREIGRTSALNASKKMVSAGMRKFFLLRNLVTEAKERMKLKITEDGRREVTNPGTV
jgi:hypothetical protein